MPFAFGAFTGFIVIAAGALVLGMSHVAAYLVGKHAGRVDAERRGRRGGGKELDRMERLETAVESIALQVERLGEGQRYLLGAPGPERPIRGVKPEQRHSTPV